MIEICSGISVSPIARFTMEAWLSGTTPSGIVNDYSLIQILVQLQILLSLFHKLSRFG